MEVTHYCAQSLRRNTAAVGKIAAEPGDLRRFRLNEGSAALATIFTVNRIFKPE